MVEEIEKLYRNFIWGSTMEKRRMHLVKLDEVFLPISNGGLGILIERCRR
jgi:hypothetical protein